MTATLGKSESGKALALNLSRLLETRLLVQANSGGGKSWLLRRLLEQTASDVQQLVIDPEGEFATLREKFDYDADAVASPQTAALLARRLLESGVSAILDIYDLKAHERHLFVRRFLDALINAPKKLWHPVLIVLDEAHVFCPQTGSAESAGAVIDLATRGRKRGQCLVAATQRLSKLHKDVAAELLNKLIGRTRLDVDVKRAADELGMTAREAMEALRGMTPGEFFCFGPALTDRVERLRVSSVATTHPKSGQRLMAAPPPPSKTIMAQLAKLGELTKEAEAEARTIEELRAENTQLKRRVTVAEKRAQTTGVPESEVVKRETAAAKAAQQQVRAERPASNNSIAVKTLRQIERLVNQALSTSAPPTHQVPVTAASKTNGSGGLRAGALRILRELVARHPAGYTRAQVGTLTRFSPRGGAFNTYLGDLRRGGYIEEHDGLVYATPTGAGILHGELPPKPTTHDEFMAQWRNALRLGAYHMLEVIVASGRENVSRDDLAMSVDMTRSGGTFITNLGDLRRNGLIVEHSGWAIANDILFPDSRNVK